jgi:ribosomal protein S12 methylthiotransferase accessory factor
LRSDTFKIYTDAQYLDRLPFSRWLPTTRLAWGECYSLRDGRKIYAPAQLLYMVYPRTKGEKVITEQSSSGMACYRDTTRAQLLALLEVLERDAVMIFWLNMLRSPQVPVETVSGIDPEIDQMLRRVRETGEIELTVKDLTTDILVPTFLCIVRNRKNPAAVAAAFAAASDLNPVASLRKALNEVLGTYAMAWHLRYQIEKGQAPAVGPTRWFLTNTLRDHVMNFATQEIHQYVEWLDEGPVVDFEQTRGFNCAPAGVADWRPDLTLKVVVDRVAEAGLECLWSDLTPGDVAEMGFHVVRALIPGTVPLHSMQSARPLGCPRLVTAPERVGLSRATRFNIVPHPYP